MPRPASQSLKIVSFPRKGRGVVAGRAFAEGELIERAPVVVISPADWELVRETDIARFCFCWRAGKEDAAIPLGRGSLINHSYSPNAYVQLRLRQRELDFLALRDIGEGEEITINYNGNPDDSRPVGFDVHDA